MRALVQRKGAVSAVSFCWADQESGKRSIAWSSGSAAPLRTDEIDEALIRSCRVLHLDGHQIDAAIHAARLANSAGVTVSLDAGTLLPRMEELLSHVDILIASEEFATTFSGELENEEQLARMKTANLKWAVVTLGARGSLGYDGSEFVRVPACQVPVIDTTGAGDVYHGAFLYAFLNAGNLLECMKTGSAAAGLKCGALGGRTAIPTREALHEFLAGTTFPHPINSNHDIP